MFITFEGIDGSGKSTQLSKIYQKLLLDGHQVIQTFEPGDTTFGKQLRQQLTQNSLDGQAELLSFLLDRSIHITTCIKPALAQGKIVLCDRYHDSTIAYQIKAKALKASWLPLWEKENLLLPNLTFLFSLPLPVIIDRLKQRQKTKQVNSQAILAHFDNNIELLTKVQKSYLSLAEANPERICVINAALSIEEITQQIYNKITSLLSV